ncbi:MAG: T9SS type A sorting domain-containing protein, partial [Rhodothermales bacterium]
VGTRAYVALGGFATSTLVGVIDVEADTLAEVIDVGCIAPRFLVVDDEDEVHVVCSGTVDFSTGDETPGAIVTLNGATGEILGRIEATTLLGPSAAFLGTGQDATYSSARQRAFVLAGEDILVLDTATNTLADTLEVTGNDLVGGLAYDDGTGRLFLTRYDPLAGFTTAGRIEIYPSTPSPPIITFDVAIAPVHIAFSRDETATAFEHTGEAAPETFVLHPNYPNPFNPTTTISFDIAQAGYVTLKIFDMLGREVATLVEAPMRPGRHETTWEAGPMAAGVYLSRLAANGQVSTRRLVLLK